METYPRAAETLVRQMEGAAAAEPARAVSFQGAPGAYSHQAVRELFPEALPLPCFTFIDAIAAVREGRAARAMIPIENSLHGRVADIHFLLPESNLHITHEHFVRVQHCLLALPGTARETISEAHSHPQALGQCRKRLGEWDIQPRPQVDTAASAALVAGQDDQRKAAVASSLAGELYGLEAVATGIEDEAHNTTRFVVLAQDPVNPPDGAEVMTTLTFEVRSVPAALFKALGGFATNGVNLTKLESYMRGGQFRAAEFYADIEGRHDDEAVMLALDELRHFSKWVRILGSYERARAR
ncbi:prephenate dehydratase [Pacificimonas sp. WHA3]|uniref:prephenate dehydratase n=1 Tax=Pacificimonas pallii TaxID=2827236 RepID=A0ABS6SFR5_9SPHN|nr:prephenate dehydratase [Pacificimonas pallii]MBV7257255.1 prephenate dehydratase [Pacificimonas pallii]